MLTHDHRNGAIGPYMTAIMPALCMHVYRQVHYRWGGVLVNACVMSTHAPPPPPLPLTE